MAEGAPIIAGAEKQPLPRLLRCLLPLLQTQQQALQQEKSVISMQVEATATETPMETMEHAPSLPPSVDGSSNDGSSADKTKLPAGKVRKIRVYPTKEQKAVFNKWLGTVRWTYNKCLEAVNKGIKKNLKELRAACLNEAALKNSAPWALETPFDIRDDALQDLLQGFKLNFAKQRAHPDMQHKFQMRYRSRKDPQQSLLVRSRDWVRTRGAYVSVFGSKVLRSAEPLPSTLEYDSRLVKDRLGRFWLCIPQPLEVQAKTKGERIIALDPGVRTFMTGYDPSGAVWEWGAGDMTGIFRLCYAADKIQSKLHSADVKALTGIKGKRKRRHLRQAFLRVHERIKCLVKDVHCKLAKWLCENYDVVVLPEFQTQGMVRKGKRCLGSKTARGMCTWSHYSFRQRLQQKARELECVVKLCSEEFTSKTCGKCGAIHSKLGGSKSFKCPACGACADRDCNGARNILLKVASETACPASAVCKPPRLAGRKRPRDASEEYSSISNAEGVAPARKRARTSSAKSPAASSAGRCGLAPGSSHELLAESLVSFGKFAKAI
jgi:putative transposase